MLHFFIGTKAQYIKTIPVIREVEIRGIHYRLIDSGQHSEIGSVMREEEGIKPPDYSLGGKKDIDTIWKALLWSTSLMLNLFRKRWIQQKVFGGHKGICIVHGDTPSTFIATLYAKRAGLKVAHLESGLRSWDIRNPFPEELIRIVVMRLADYLFTPGEEATNNLVSMKVKGEIYQMSENTTHEALKISANIENGEVLEPENYSVFTCHRVENLKSSKTVQALVTLMEDKAEKTKVVFVTHGPTLHTFEKMGVMERIRANPNIKINGLMDHSAFTTLLSKAMFVVTDGGSIQEECAVLGVPTLVWRTATERNDGIGRNVVLSLHEPQITQTFFNNIESYRFPVSLSDSSPSKEVVDILAKEQI